MAYDFSAYQAVLLDLDGTVYHEDHALPGAIDLLHQLQTSGPTFACLSNSTSSPKRVVARLRRMGVDLQEHQIFTAAATAVDYVIKRFGAGGKPRVFNLATEGVREMLKDRAESVPQEIASCDAVIIGAPTNTFADGDRPRNAVRMLRAGAIAVGVCNDRVYPSQRGLEIGSGAFTRMLSYAAGVEPIFCGKPGELFFRELCHRLNVEPENCILIGDNIESDVRGAKRVGMDTILTLTGVATRGEVDGLSADLRPDHVVEDLTKLL